MNLDKYEKENNYTLKIIPLKDVENVLLDSIKDKEINSIIAEEMIAVLNAIKEET